MQESRRPGLELARGFVTGLIGGAGAGLLTAIVPVIGLLLLAIGVTAAITKDRTIPSARPKGFSMAAGFLVGSGALYLYGSWNVISACELTDDFCGNANVTPLLVGGIVLVVLGVLAAVWAVLMARRVPSR